MVIVSSCAVSSTLAADMAPALLNLYSLITDALKGLAGDSCTLIHNSSWVKFAAEGIFGVVYMGKNTNRDQILPWHKFFTVTYRLLPVKLESRFLFWQLHTIISHLSLGSLFRLWIN